MPGPLEESSPSTVELLVGRGVTVKVGCRVAEDWDFSELVDAEQLVIEVVPEVQEDLGRRGSGPGVLVAEAASASRRNLVFSRSLRTPCEHSMVRVYSWAAGKKDLLSGSYRPTTSEPQVKSSSTPTKRAKGRES